MAREWNNELLETPPINTESLVEAVEAASGGLVFDDHYGGGVAIIENKRYATYHALARAFGIDITDHLEPTIALIDREIKVGECTVWAHLTDGTYERLFSYFTDELSIGSHQLLDKTVDEARAYRAQLDAEYLRS